MNRLKSAKSLGIKTLAFGSLAVILSMQACETEIDINAPYEDLTIVYGLLNPIQNFVDPNTRHEIKINKAFLGEGDATVFAQQRDSLEYDFVTGVVREFRVDVAQSETIATGTVFPLYADTVDNKEEGAFFGPEQTIYVFDGTLQVPTSSATDFVYQLDLTVGGENGKQVSASTPMIGRFEFGRRTGQQSVALNFANETAFVTAIELDFVSARHGRVYEMSMEWSYTDFFEDNTAEQHTLRWQIGTEVARDVRGGEDMAITVAGEEFYQFLRNNIPPYAETFNEAGSPLAGRVGEIEVFLIIDAGGEELYTYISVNEPTTGIIQERPEYTNVTNGIGIFSTRSRITINKPLGQPTLEEMATGNLGGYTNGLGITTN